MLNPFRKYAKRSEEEVKLQNVRFRSHEKLTYYLPLEKGFNRKNVLPADQMRRLHEMAAKIKWQQR